MKAVFLRTCTLLLASSLAACASTSGGGNAAGGTEVTTTHLGQPIARSRIAIEAFDAADANSPDFTLYELAVLKQLSRLGWTYVGAVGESEQVALIDVQQGSRAALTGKLGIGGMPNGGTASSGSVATMLEVRIRRRSDGTVVWEGRAISEDSAGRSHLDTVDALATALFRDFPGISGRTIRAR
jgi:hypothetical protein